MTTKQGLLWIPVAVVLTLAPSAVNASCIAPAPEMLWVYPSDGQTDVSIWSELYVAVPLGVKVQGSANGEELNGVEEGLGRFVWSQGLKANTEYTVTLVISSEFPSEDPSMAANITQEIVFTTGADTPPPDAPALQPQVTAYGLQEGFSHLSDSCQAIVSTADCYDTGQDTLLTLQAEDTDAVGWLIDRIDGEGNQYWSRLWPAQCGHPGVFLHSSAVEAGTVGCYALRTLHDDGIGARYAMSCDPFIAEGWYPPEEPAEADESGCAMAQKAPNPDWRGAALVGGMIILLMGWRRRVRHA